MSVFQALTLAISFALLVIEILKFNQKNNRLTTLTG
ncbi:putative holin-like toxin [Pediococcus acidilactici]